MDNPILNAEQFSRAVGSFGSDVEQMALQQRWFGQTVDRLRTVQQEHERVVDKLIRAMGMQAENDQRKAVGSSMAYTEEHFADL